jgi:menaquinone-dependent protoporphyrinogen IX oxidase
MSKLVAYYSRNGSTKSVAEMVAEKLEAELFEIVDLTNRKGIIGFIKAGFQARKKVHSSIKSLPLALFDGVEEVIIASPIWASNLAPAINTFIDKAHFEGRLVKLIIVQADPNHKAAEEVNQYVRKRVESKDGTFEKYLHFAGSPPGKKPNLNNLKEQVSAKFN